MRGHTPFAEKGKGEGGGGHATLCFPPQYQISSAAIAKAVLQPAKVANKCMAYLEYAYPPPPIPPFVLVQNLSSQQVVPTDNMVITIQVM